ncbi:MAG: 30S ribosomal protein S19e [Nitrososphaeraceae archaeon]|nr:30S ribosomal protein S19e [Nitrososphaeraceae archaeon]
MAKAYDIPADKLISKIAENLKKDKKLEPLPWIAFVKTGCHVDKIPQNKDWWYLRCASLLRKVYIHGPVSISDLKSVYGGKKQIGYNLAHHKDAGGAIIRKALQQLESSGYIVKNARGRVLSDEGMKRIDRIATDLYKELIIATPALQRYG